jgi:hypothetical protein
MIRLNEPEYDLGQTLEECVNGITGNDALRNNVVDSKPGLIEMGAQYLDAAANGNLYAITPVNAAGNADPVVVHTLTKSDLVKVYEQYFRAKEKPARKIYDSLLNAAQEKCPFCGGIGTPQNLDHYLPKTHFPQFSVLPRNLVPSCRDCNIGEKASTFATNAQDQVIQPYADDDKFFSSQWIYATYHGSINSQPGEFEYYTDPPAEWSSVDKRRVEKHFKDFDLAKRYAIKAAESLRTVLDPIEAMKQAGISYREIERMFLQPVVNSERFANHWRKIMYQALIQTLSIIN